MQNTLADWIQRNALLLSLALIIIVVASAFGLQQGKFDSDYRVFFSGSNPQLQAFDKLQNTYAKNDNVMFVLAPKNGNVFTPETLGAVEYLSGIDQAWQIPFSLRVDSITNFQYTYAEEDDLIVEDLVTDAENLTELEINRIRKVALAEPQLRDRLISGDSEVTAVNVTIQLPDEDKEKAIPEVVAKARALAEEIKQLNPNMAVYLTGMVMFNNAFAESSQYDLQYLFSLMLLAVIIFFGIFLRSLAGVIGSITVILLSIFAAMGLACWSGIAFTGPTMSAPTIILTLGVADCVHIMASFIQAMHRGLDKNAAMKESLQLNLQPVFLTSITTAIGFLSMNFSDAPPFRDLGNIVAVGVMFAFALSVTLLPALVRILPIKTKASTELKLNKAMNRLANVVITKRKPIYWSMLAVSIGFTFLAFQNEFNDQFVDYFDETVEFRQATDFTVAHLTGLNSVEFSIESGTAGGISNPAYLEDLDKFTTWLRSQPAVMHVTSITDTFKRLNMNMHGDDPAYYRLPDDRELAAQFLLLYEMSLPIGLDLNNQINVSKSATRISASIGNLSSKEIIELTDNATAWMRANLPNHMHAEGSSPSVMFAHIGQRNITQMMAGTTLALVLISLLLVFALRSLKFGLLSLIPNLVPVGIAFGCWWVFSGEIGLALSVVIGMTLGIVVDDTVHFLSKYLRARRDKNMTPEAAIRYAFRTVGPALLITTIILVIGFMILAQSHFKINSDMGLLTSVTIAIALILDYLFLPVILLKVDKSK